MAAPALDLAYRHSAIGPSQVVVRAELALERGDAARAEATIASIVRWRRENQPGGQNAGSVFTNPPDDSAGRLIDAAGCKGLRHRHRRGLRQARQLLHRRRRRPRRRRVRADARGATARTRRPRRLARARDAARRLHATLDWRSRVERHRCTAASGDGPAPAGAAHRHPARRGPPAAAPRHRCSPPSRRATSIGLGVTQSPVLDVDRITVTGAAHTPVDVVRAASGIHVHRPMTGVDLDRARRGILALPWVQNVSVAALVAGVDPRRRSPSARPWQPSPLVRPASRSSTATGRVLDDEPGAATGIPGARERAAGGTARAPRSRPRRPTR